MEGTSRIKMEKNVFESNGWGMKIQASCMDNEIVSIILWVILLILAPMALGFKHF
jgi:hypothetical protein